MPGPPPLHDLACVVHVHSTHSDGTGTVPQIAAAAARVGVDVVLLTDHDTLAARALGDERWHGSTLVLVGEEVSPRARNHFLAFDIDEPIDHRALDGAGVLRAVAAAGGFGFAAHPFSAGSPRFERYARGTPWPDLEEAGVAGMEVWSLVTDVGEGVRSLSDAARFVATPDRAIDHPAARNLAAWDRMSAARRVVGIGGLDAHQFGKRVGSRVPLRVMSYARSFRLLRTHVLCEQPPSGETVPDREQVYAALRGGRCYLARDSIASARGFTFWAEGAEGVLAMGAEAAAGTWRMRTRTPRAASLRLLRDGTEVARIHAAELELDVEEPGVYRVEAQLRARGRDRTWILSNPIHLR